MKTKTSPTKNSMNRSPFCRGFLLILLVLACFSLSPTARATCQEGCLSSNNTAIGASAGDSIQAGNDNIFIGFTAGEMVQGGSHNIEIAHHGTPGDIATIRIGTKKNQKNTYIAGITGVT